MNASTEIPDVTIAMAVRNEAPDIVAALDSCLNQNYSGNIEIVVADGESTDGTRAILDRYASQGTLTVANNPGLTAPSGLNIAIAASSAPIVVRCDGHSFVPPDHVAMVVATLDRTGAGYVGGVQHAVGGRPMQRGIARAMTNRVGIGGAAFHRTGHEGPVDTAYLGGYLRSALDEVGLFDEQLDRNQDYELNIRLRSAGFIVWFDPNIVTEYRPRASLRALWRQFFDYGKWKRRVLRLHPQSLKLRQAGPPILAAGIAGSVALLATPWRLAGIFVIAGYASALIAVGVFEAARTKDFAGFLAAPAIATMHLAWGTGFITGRTQPTMHRRQQSDQRPS
jgi:succinoglycan biosynthesis protein ExoA